MKLQMRFKLFHSNKNLEFVNLKCVTYAQPIPMPLTHTYYCFRSGVDMDLMNAAREGNTDECEQLMMSGVDPNFSNEVFIWKKIIRASYNPLGDFWVEQGAKHIEIPPGSHEKNIILTQTLNIPCHPKFAHYYRIIELPFKTCSEPPSSIYWTHQL